MRITKTVNRKYESLEMGIYSHTSDVSFQQVFLCDVIDPFTRSDMQYIHDSKCNTTRSW
jgi:hypothetical protein